MKMSCCFAIFQAKMSNICWFNHLKCVIGFWTIWRYQFWLGEIAISLFTFRTKTMNRLIVTLNNRVINNDTKTETEGVCLRLCFCPSDGTGLQHSQYVSLAASLFLCLSAILCRAVNRDDQLPVTAEIMETELRCRNKSSPVKDAIALFRIEVQIHIMVLLEFVIPGDMFHIAQRRLNAKYQVNKSTFCTARRCVCFKGIFRCKFNLWSNTPWNCVRLPLKRSS